MNIHINLHRSQVILTQSIRKGQMEKKQVLVMWVMFSWSGMFALKIHRNHFLSLAAQLRRGFGFSERSQNICPLQPSLKC